MSHIVSIETKITDLEAVKAACQRLKWIFRAGQQTYIWFGQFVGDSPLPKQILTAEERRRVEAMTLEEKRKIAGERLGKCEHAIRVPGCVYEIGLQKVEGSWAPLWDYWEPAMYEAMGVDGGRFLQAYAVEKARLEAHRLGHTCSEQVLEDGSIKLTIAESF